MSNKFSMDDYVDVAERIQDFKDAHPDGSLQTGMWSDGEWFKVVEVDGKIFIVYRAEAYRTPDDQRPGHGIAWEPFPGKTPYTANSELMNAETAAWGRAIVALGLTANRKLASRQEVRARAEEQEAESKPAVVKETRSKASTRTQPATPAVKPEDGSQPVSEDTLKEMGKRYKASGITAAAYKAILKECGLADGRKSDELTEDQATWVVIKLNTLAEQQAKEKAA